MPYNYTKNKNNHNFHIGTYYLAPYARSLNHIQDLASCGINFVINIPNDHTLLNMLYEHGVYAIVNGVFPSWFGGDGSNAGTLSGIHPLEEYCVAIEHFSSHPAIWGIDVGDEPSILEFDHYSKVFDLIHKKLPALYPYLNLYPSYAVKGNNTLLEIQQQLGTNSHAEYINTFCQKVTSEYICFDYYLYSASLDGLYHSLKTISEACKKYKRELWMVLQINSNDPKLWINSNQLRFQAFTAMAFGATTLIWACYTAGWWYNNVLDSTGDKTRQYNRLKEVNSEIILLSEEFMKYKNKSTHFVGDFSIKDLVSFERLDLPFVEDLHADHNQALLIGEMYLSDDKHALFIFAAIDSSGENQDYFKVSFKCTDYDVNHFGFYHNMNFHNDNMEYSFMIQASEAIFITFKRATS